MKTLEFVEKMEEHIVYYVEDSYEMPHASLWVFDDSNHAIKLIDNSDVYELLENIHTVNALINHKQDGFVVLTCGWAAAIDDCDDDTPPSQAPNKRRVRLVTGANSNGVATVIRFKDDTMHKITDEGSARGSLADSVQQLHSMIQKEKNQNE